jgi:hypothetical protein
MDNIKLFQRNCNQKLTVATYLYGLFVTNLTVIKKLLQLQREPEGGGGDREERGNNEEGERSRRELTERKRGERRREGEGGERWIV